MVKWLESHHFRAVRLSRTFAKAARHFRSGSGPLPRHERTSLATNPTHDLCVIGAGASGIAVAEAAVRLGASVIVVERGEMGGQSLRAGSLALSALAAAAHKANAARTGAPFGVIAEDPKVNFRRVHDHIAEIITQASPEFGAARLAALGIEVVKGTAAFVDPHSVRTADATITARRYVIATGASPSLPDVPGLFSVPYFTTETIFDNTRKLTHLVIIGAGPMGLELALSYRRLGCEVSVVETGGALAGADPELASIALRGIRNEGIALYENSGVVSVHARRQGIGVVIRAGEGNANLDVSHILVTPDRAANLGALNLDAAKIRLDKPGGSLRVNSALRTTNGRVFAVGEAMHPGIAHDVALEADIVVRAALLRQPARYEPAAVTRLTLTDPEIAETGLSEPMARSRFKTAFEVLRVEYAASDRARAGRNGAGVVKLIVGRSGQILGAGIVGAGAGELAANISLAIARQMKLADLALLSAPYPSHAELLRDLGAAAMGKRGPTALETRLLALNRLLP